jgi:hypothetical protein
MIHVGWFGQKIAMFMVAIPFTCRCIGEVSMKNEILRFRHGVPLLLVLALSGAPAQADLLGAVGGVVGGTLDTVGGAVGGVTDTVGNTVGGVTDTLGQTVGGVTGTVGNTVDGLIGTVDSTLGGGGSGGPTPGPAPDLSVTRFSDERRDPALARQFPCAAGGNSEVYRGQPVTDRSGNPLGIVHDVIVNARLEVTRIRFLSNPAITERAMCIEYGGNMIRSNGRSLAIGMSQFDLARSAVTR